MDEKKTIVRLALAQLSRRDRLEVLAEYGAPNTVRPSAVAGTEVWPRIKVAQHLNRSLRFVDLLARQGLLRRRILPGRKRAIGFLASDVLKLLACDGAAEIEVQERACS